MSHVICKECEHYREVNWCTKICTRWPTTFEINVVDGDKRDTTKTRLCEMEREPHWTRVSGIFGVFSSLTCCGPKGRYFKRKTNKEQ